jgi:hypothetical protein
VSINFLPFLIVWSALAAAVIVLFFKHRSIARQEDAHLNVLETADIAQQQVALERRLEVIDKWGKILTAVVVLSGLALGILYFIQSWEQMSRTGV